MGMTEGRVLARASALRLSSYLKFRSSFDHAAKSKAKHAQLTEEVKLVHKWPRVFIREKTIRAPGISGNVPSGRSRTRTAIAAA
jgi:hypothetical protein